MVTLTISVEFVELRLMAPVPTANILETSVP